MKKYWLIGIVLSLFSFCSFASTTSSNSDYYEVYQVDHENYQLIINDKIYKMPITLKVFKYDTLTEGLRVVNRYAIKIGQRVVIRTYVRNKQVYISNLIIF